MKLSDMIKEMWSSKKERTNRFPFNHLRILGIDKLNPYLPEEKCLVAEFFAKEDQKPIHKRTNLCMICCRCSKCSPGKL